jgi:hypothetical protein
LPSQPGYVTLSAIGSTLAEVCQLTAQLVTRDFRKLRKVCAHFAGFSNRRVSLGAVDAHQQGHL